MKKLLVVCMIVGIVLTAGCSQVVNKNTIDEKINKELNSFFEEKNYDEYEILSEKNINQLIEYQEYLEETGINFISIDSYFDEGNNIVWSMYTGYFIDGEKEVVFYLKSEIKEGKITSITKYRYINRELESETR